MIISASRRTDIPCFYGEWFMNRLRAGFVCTRNPMNHAQVKTIHFTPRQDCFIFWTKDSHAFEKHLSEIQGRGFHFYFQFTLTPYDKSLESGLREKEDIMESFIALSKAIGKTRVLWRYDPIVFNETCTLAYHREKFRWLCQKLHPYTESITISFLDGYAKLKKKLQSKQIGEATMDEMLSLSEYIAKEAASHGLKAKACCESSDLLQCGIEGASCIDKKVIEQLYGHPIEQTRDKNQRKGCGCIQSVDIGAYNSCLNGCIYCYANQSATVAKKRYEAHDPTGAFLIPSF